MIRLLFRLFFAAAHVVRRNGRVSNFLGTARIYDPLAKLCYQCFRLTRARTSSPTGEITVHGITFSLCDPSFYYLFWAASGRHYEPSVTYHLKSLVEKSPVTFLDIGACYGYFTAFVGKVNSECLIYSFEPNSTCFDILLTTIELNKTRAMPYKLALSDEPGKIAFFGKTMKATSRDSETVEAITFDELRQREGIRPDIVKIDVHGGEGKVLYGMRNALKEDISHIYCEIHRHELLADYSVKDVLDVLLASGFQLYELERFRHEKIPKMMRVTGRLYDDMVRPDRWTPLQRKTQRMIYATKRPL